MRTRHLLTSILLSLPVALLAQTFSLDDCQKAARENYPLIKRYDLISRTTDLTVSNLNKQWLPQVGASAQATYQSDVMTLPDALKDMLEQRSYNVKGLRKDQYRVGLSVEQNIFDGGRISNQKNVAKAQGEVDKAQNDVNLYTVTQRVNELYFGVLTIDERLKINNDLQTLLQSNLDKLNAMYKGGTATRSDVSSVKAEKLNAEQQETELKNTRWSLIQMLGVFCGIGNITEISKPNPTLFLPHSGGESSSHLLEGTGAAFNNRPELQLVDAQLKLADAQEKQLKSNLMPRLSAFAQGYYGYPGYDMFHDMFHRDWTLNGTVGLKLTWSIGSLYTNRNDHAKIQAQRDLAENYRETFLFNNLLDKIKQDNDIQKYRKMMIDDEKIVELRRDVRMAAESKLNHGIIDTNNLLQEINRENQAKNNMSIHEVEMLKQMYDLKYTLNQ